MWIGSKVTVALMGLILNIKWDMRLDNKITLESLGVDVRNFIKVAGASLLPSVGLMHFMALEKKINFSIFANTLIPFCTDINI